MNRRKSSSLWVQAVGALLACLLTSAPAAERGVAETQNRRDAVVNAVAKAMPCVVNIGTETIVDVQDPFEELLRDFWGPYHRRRRPESQYSLGSGVIIDEAGYVLTNEHVVRRATHIWVRLTDEAGGEVYEAERVAGTSRSDVALLRIKGKKDEKFQAARFAADDDLILGETVIALGNPFGLGGSVSRGILSSKSRRPPKDREPMDVADWLQTDAAINPGNSGGPLVNLNGEIIGISVAVYREGQGIGFAIPVKRVTEALSEIISPEISQLWLGARIRPGGQALTVSKVDRGSPAEKAGLKQGDVIVGINGKKPRGFIEFNQELSSAGDKKDVSLIVDRAGTKFTATLRLVRESAVFNAALIKQKLGVSVQQITGELAERLGLVTTEGLLVAAVEAGSPAADAQLQRGHILLALDGEEAEDVTAMAKVLFAKKKGEKVALDVLVQHRRGPFIMPQRASVEMPVR